MPQITIRSVNDQSELAKLDGPVHLGQIIPIAADGSHWRIVLVDGSKGMALATPEEGRGGRPAVRG